MSPAILADVGGTNVRFATWSPSEGIKHREAWLTALYPDFATAFNAYAKLAGLTRAPSAVAVCAAGPLLDGQIDLTNCAWKLSLNELDAATRAERVVLVNDFAAVARALPELTPSDHTQIGGASPEPSATKLALGPGTGLGVACTVADGKGGWIANPGEGGHADLAVNTDREIAVQFYLLREFGHVSVERVLSGPGLENLYLALAALDGKTFKQKPQAHEISKAAHAGTDSLALEAVEMFTAILGSTAGSLALSMGARGGVYIAGGIVKQWGTNFNTKLFRHRLEAKGRMRHYLEPIPCYLVTAEDLAFKGLAAMIAQAQ